MAVIPINPAVQYPPVVLTSSASSASAIDASGEYQAIILQADRAGSIVKAVVTLYAVSSGVADVRIETVDADTGHPTGTLLSANGNASFSPGAIGVHTITLTEPVAVAQGDIFALVFRWVSGSMSIRTTNTLFTFSASAIVPYRSGSTGTPQLGTQNLMCGVLFSDGYGVDSPVLYPGTPGTNDSTGNREYGCLFSLDFSCVIRGFLFVYAPGNVDVTFKLYDAADNVLAQRTYDEDQKGTTSLSGLEVVFASDIQLTAGEHYRITIQSATGSAAFTMYPMMFGSAENMTLSPGRGKFIKTERLLAGGAWTDTNTATYQISLLINGIVTEGSQEAAAEAPTLAIGAPGMALL